MRFVVQRVTHASVTVDGNVIGKIGQGFMVLIGVSDEDTKETADKMVKKLLGLRIFEDENGKTNLDIHTVGGEYIIAKCREQVEIVETGEFGADMKVELLNDGPFTILLDSDQLA